MRISRWPAMRSQRRERSRAQLDHAGSSWIAPGDARTQQGADSALAERIRRRAGRAALNELPAALLDGLCAYAALLRRWNARMNLTALGDDDGGVDRLIVEPLLAVRHLANPAGKVIDVGSGGGSPAVPFRLAMRGGSMVMVEAKARKAAFLREAIRRLDLPRTSVEADRFEDLLARRPVLRGAFDALTVRGVRVDESALRALQPFVRDGGELLLFTRTDREAGAAWTAPPPPLALRATHRLVESPDSQLVVLRKQPGQAKSE